MTQHTETLWRELSEQLRQFIISRVNDISVSEDILQDVFVKIHANIETLKDETRLESWVYQITRNAIIDHYRTRKISEELPEAIPADSNPPFQQSRHSEDILGLRGMIDDLPEKYREALLLTEYRGLTQKQLAERLGISVSGAKSRVQRARQLLKDELLECCHLEFDHYGTVIDYHPITCCCCAEHQRQQAACSPSCKPSCSPSCK